MKENIKFENSEQQNKSNSSMSKILMMNFRSKNLGVQEGSNVGSIQSHALRHIGRQQSSSNLGSQLLDSQNNSLLVFDGDDSKNSRESKKEASSFGCSGGSIGRINVELR
jgi:hypothetical protein